MKTYFFTSLLIIFLFSNVFAASTKEVYELQEKCGKSSAEFFKKVYGTGYDIKGIDHSYESHYNKKLNKCFIKMLSIVSDENDKTSSVMLEIYDVQENIQYGHYFENSERMNCWFQNKICNSKSQWFQLTKPFMEK